MAKHRNEILVIVVLYGGLKVCGDTVPLLEFQAERRPSTLVLDGDLWHLFGNKDLPHSNSADSCSMLQIVAHSDCTH